MTNYQFLNNKTHYFVHSPEYYNPYPLINYYIKERDKKSVLLLVYEEFLSDKKSFLKKFHDFSETSIKSEVNFEERVNASLPASFIPFVRTINKIFSSAFYFSLIMLF